MNRRQLFVLLLALVVLGGAGLALFWRELEAYRASGARIGAPLLPGFQVSDVARIRLRDARAQTTLVKKEERWVVEERGGYTADFQAIGDFIVKLIELKVTQAEQVGEGLLPRVELVEPGKGEGSGTLVQFEDASGKILARLVLGKKVLKKDPVNPLPGARDGVPAGRYVRDPARAGTVFVVSDPLNAADANPGRWLAKDFFKVERVKALEVEPEGGAGRWKIVRDEEWGEWRFADGAGALDRSAAVSAANALGRLEFKDVATDSSGASAGKSVKIVAETFDRLTYTVRLAAQPGAEDYRLAFSVAGEPPRTRTPEKAEKPDEKERRDKEFAESLKRLEERLAREKELSRWTFVVAKREVEPLLKRRDEMIRRPQKAPGQ
jgi:hypothetical protein